MAAMSVRGSSKEDTTNNLKKLANLASLQSIEYEIIQIDNILERVHELFPTNPQVRIFSARVSDALFELEEALHGLDVANFTGKARGQEVVS
jgi:hypothetical protein